MKKYKLIKEYPGSPKLGIEITQLECDSIECYPEFWEEVVEKDYEILSFNMSIRQQKLANLQKDGSYLHTELLSTVGGTSLKFMLENKIYDIHSVKRLSDGEIFTVGDNTKYGCIDGFYIKNDYLLVTTVLESIGRYLKDIQRIKKPLFTTEDGVDIFEGDSYWKVSNNFNKSGVRLAKQTFRGNASNCTSKYFKTLKSAEEYILMNKPCLSINDVTNTLANYSTNLINNLKNKINEKNN